MIDEFPQTLVNIEQKHGQIDAVKLLQWKRVIRQNYAPANVQFIYTGSIGINAIASKLKASKTISDLSVIEIPPLTPAEAQEFINKLLTSAEVKYSNSLSSKLIAQINWLNPFHIQLMIQELIDQYDELGEILDQKHIDRAFQTLIAFIKTSTLDTITAVLRTHLIKKTFLLFGSYYLNWLKKIFYLNPILKYWLKHLNSNQISITF